MEKGGNMSDAGGPKPATIRDLTLSYRNIVVSAVGNLLEVVVESPTGTKRTQISMESGDVVGGQNSPKE
jgi:hypothetical protein